MERLITYDNTQPKRKTIHVIDRLRPGDSKIDIFKDFLECFCIRDVKYPHKDHGKFCIPCADTYLVFENHFNRYKKEYESKYIFTVEWINDSDYDNLFLRNI